MLLKDINPGPGNSTPFNFILLDDVVYFQANTHQIWRTDGTIGGTYLMVNNNQITNPYGFVKTKNSKYHLPLLHYTITIHFFLHNIELIKNTDA